MNNVYYMLRNEFEADDTYTGSDIMKVVLKTIKVRTNLLKSQIFNVKKTSGLSLYSGGNCLV